MVIFSPLQRPIEQYRRTINPPYKNRDYLILVVTLLLLFAIPLTVIAALKTEEPVASAAYSGPVRGVVGDLWADTVVGKPDFTEIVPNTVVPDKLYKAAGATVDRASSPQKLYIYDSGNSRVLGLDWEKCLASTSDPANCSADMVIGQKDLYSSACNGDSGFQNFPVRAQASAATLCGQREDILSLAEGYSASNMKVDIDGNLYVTDIWNNRVLRYNKPFETDAVADFVWGQNDFTGVDCNKSNRNNPDATTLCLFAQFSRRTAGVDVDSDGNVWIADTENHRVLRYPSGSQQADLVLGQAVFTSRTGGSGLNQFNQPVAVRVNSLGSVYVADFDNSRVMVFKQPLSNGMDGSVFVEGFRSTSIEFDPTQPGVWISSTSPNHVVERWDESTGAKLGQIGKTGDGNVLGNPGGSMGIDTSGNMLVTPSEGGRRYDVMLYVKSKATDYPTRRLFGSTRLGNAKTASGLGWGRGVEVADNQLIVSDYGRLLFWNDPISLTNGKPADGYAGLRVDSFEDRDDGCCGTVRADRNQRLWTLGGYRAGVAPARIELFDLPLKSGAKPVGTIEYPIPVLGGGEIAYNAGGVRGLAPTANSEFLWISHTATHRVFRIRDPLTNPVVDVIIGQKNYADQYCNQDPNHPANTNAWYSVSGAGYPYPGAGVSTLCYPGAITLDKEGNLFVSDHSLEIAGNKRLLAFSKDLFPTDNTEVIYAPSATKIFHNVATFEPAFDSQNRMIIGFNMYWGPNPGDPSAFYAMYTDPLGSSTTPTYLLKDYFSMGYSAVFDDNDDLYVGDANRGRLLVYKGPLAVSDPPPSDGEKPTVSITSPEDKSTVSKTIDVSGVADDNQGVVRVELYVDGDIKFVGKSVVYSYSWDTTKVTDGDYTLWAKSYDGVGNVGMSSLVAVTVQNNPADTQKPTAPTNLRGRVMSSTRADLTWGASTDNVGVTGYGVFRDNNRIKVLTGRTFTDKTVKAGITYKYYVQAYDAAGNISNKSNVVRVTTPKGSSGTPRKLGDLNGDGKVDIFDLSTLLSRWRSTNKAADLNNSGRVDIFDLSILLSRWGR